MRSPEGWPPAPRRRTRLLLPWLLAAAVAVALAVVLALQLRPSSVDAPPLASTAPSEDCALGDCLAAAPPGPAVPPAGPAPEITAQAAAVVEDSCGALVYGKSADLQLPPASLTKLATALVAVERTPDLSRKVDVRVNSGLLAASTNSTIMGLRPGVRLSMRDLLAGLLLVSGNDAAIAIAEEAGPGYPSFVALMNEKAGELGLRNTRFTNPHGLDERGLHSSAFDMATLGRAVLAQPELAALVGARRYAPDWDRGELWNSNELLDLYPGALGVKIGYTSEAGQTMVAAAERDGRRLIVSVLGSADRYADVIALLDWAFGQTSSACEV